MKTNRYLGSILILIGTTIGAGMLALPLISATTGFILTSILLSLVWALMAATGLLVLEANLVFSTESCSFSTMAAKALGPIGKYVAWISCLLLLYSLTAAYTAGAASLLSNLFNILFAIKVPSWVNAILFVTVLGSTVFWSTKAVDYANRSLLSIKGILLIGSLIFLAPHVNFLTLLSDQSPHSAKYLWQAAPIFLCAFGYHAVIPSLRIYLGDEVKQLKSIIIWGSAIPLFFYLLWLATTLGIIPLIGNHSFIAITKNNGSVGEFIQTISFFADNNLFTAFINGFANIATTTSFLGVSLGLFDFLADGFKRSNTRYGRFQTTLLTYIPPTIFALFYPQGFVIALGYAAIFVAILEVILPGLIVYQLRKNATLTFPYQMWGGNLLLWLIVVIGALFIIIQIMASLNLLPAIR